CTGRVNGGGLVLVGKLVTVVRTLAQQGEAIRGIHGHLQGVLINEELNALRFIIGMAEEENASLHGRIKTIEAIDTITRRQEKRDRIEIMPTTRQGANVVMTLEAVQAVINQTLLRDNTTDDGSQNTNGGPRRPMQPARAALTWWNGHVRTLGHDAAYAMTWEILKKKLTEKYCPKGEIKKLEIELWNLKTLDDAIELANYLMDQKLRTYAERQPENKGKLDNNNQAQQQLLKKQNVVQAYVVGTREKKPYGGSKPLCPKCNYHHDGECSPKSDCPMLKNQGTEAREMVYALGGGETNQDLDNTEDDINA
nr:hypothetical protein [Tanacetum cinerariifolium]